MATQSLVLGHETSLIVWAPGSDPCDHVVPPSVVTQEEELSVPTAMQKRVVGHDTASR
jgi:hypothetical protein